MKAYFISDIHLKEMHERNGEILLRFLHFLTTDLQAGDCLFLLGDIFDLWLSDHPVFIKKYSEVIQCLQALQNAKVRLIYFEGNHDLHLAPFWKNELGFEVYTQAKVFDFHGFFVRAEHGDLINLEDKAYLRYRAFTRHPFIEFLGHNLPGIFWDRLGNWASKKSRAHSSSYREGHEELLIGMIRKHATRALQEGHFDLIVTGHMHVKDDYSIPGSNSRSINLGSWFHDVKALKMEIQPSQIHGQASGVRVSWMDLL